MRKTSLLVMVLVSICFLFPACSSDEPLTTFFLVRHAEKASDGSRDPDLTASGLERAAELAVALGQVKLDAIFDTPYKRTRQTVTPIAEQQGQSIQTIASLKKEDLVEFVDQTVARFRGGNILIASHSNIVPALIKIIKREPFEMASMKQMSEDAYDDLYVVVFSRREDVKVFNLKYGDHSALK